MMTEAKFNTTNLSKIMSFASYVILDELLQAAQSKQRYPIPTVKYFTAKRPSRLLTAVVLRYVRLVGGEATENIQGSLRKERGEWKYSFTGGRPGQADITIFYRGRVMECEIKIGKDRQSEAQKKYEKRMEKVGVPYRIVTGFDQFIEIFNEFK